MIRRVAWGQSSTIPDMDFETYSEAGFIFDEIRDRWISISGKGKKAGLSEVGTAVYAQHPTTEIISLAYDLKQGAGPQLWIPGAPPPEDLLRYILAGGIIEAHRAIFEYFVWNEVGCRLHGWPRLPVAQLRCSMGKARAFALPGKLEKAAEVIRSLILKDKEGDRLIKKFSIPRSPTKRDRRLRIHPSEDIKDATKFYSYNVTDIKAEAALSERCPDLQPEEQEFFAATLQMNIRGIGVDRESIEACIDIIEQALETYSAEINKLTGGVVSDTTQVERLKGWLHSQGMHVDSLDSDALESLLERDFLSGNVKRVLQLRKAAGYAAVKKVYAMRRMLSEGDRLCDLYEFHGARTGRDTGRAVQPTNLVKDGVLLKWCGDAMCGRPYGAHLRTCPWCNANDIYSTQSDWNWRACDHVLDVVKTRRLDYVRHYFGDPLRAISGCIRGLFCAAPGHDLISSDYSAIEAVVTAVLADEQWRIDAFARGEDIYYQGAAGVTGRTYEEYINYAKQHGEKHPDRQKIGKPAELSCGFGGWIGAWRKFDDSDNFTDDEVKKNILAWRNASPHIVEMWGGQVRGKPWAPERYELYGFEGAAIRAIQNPGTCYETHGIGFGVTEGKLFVRLPSGRFLTYHNPRLRDSTRWDGQLKIVFNGWNSNPQNGPVGWIEMETYGGKLTENIVQATARDVLRFAIINLERAGYPVVLRTYDEVACEVPENFGSIEELESIMNTMPPWAQGWPIVAKGGWRGKRYRKD